jgi:hypothetical protein
MRNEHCESEDSLERFIAPNYHVETCPRNEWAITVENDLSQANMGHNRRCLSIQQLMEFAVSREARLSRVEVIAVVLYTGPMVGAFKYKLLGFAC